MLNCPCNFRLYAGFNQASKLPTIQASCFQSVMLFQAYKPLSVQASDYLEIFKTSTNPREPSFISISAETFDVLNTFTSSPGFKVLNGTAPVKAGESQTSTGLSEVITDCFPAGASSFFTEADEAQPAAIKPKIISKTIIFFIVLPPVFYDSIGVQVKCK
jgi:hypothetical protein